MEVIFRNGCKEDAPWSSSKGRKKMVEDDDGRLGLFLETLNVKRLEVHIFIFAVLSRAYFA